jgi:hypothetical protein
MIHLVVHVLYALGPWKPVLAHPHHIANLVK